MLPELERELDVVCPQMCEAGIENPKKNVWLNKSIYPLNKTFLLGKKAKNTFFTQEAKPKKKCFHFRKNAMPKKELASEDFELSLLLGP